MAPRHPFEWMTASVQKRVFVVYLVITLVLMVSLNMIGAPLMTGVAPAGIVSFELAGELPLAQHMIESWGHTGQVYAGISLGLDYLFIVAYASSIALGSVLVARSLSQQAKFFTAVGVLLAWAQLVAAMFDAIENYALIQVLLGAQYEAWPMIAKWCAVPKFIIIAIGLLYVVIGVVLAIIAKVRRGEVKPV